MDRLKELLAKVKCGTSIAVNPHREYYQTVEQYFDDLPNDKRDIPAEVWDEMVRKDAVVSINAYPSTPVGSYSIYHHDLDAAIEQMIICVDSD